MSEMIAFALGVAAGGGFAALLIHAKRWRPAVHSVVELCDGPGAQPARRWRDRVRYDAWGAPFVHRHPDTKVYAITLNSDGTVARDFRKPRWKLVSGPPVQFPA